MLEFLDTHILWWHWTVFGVLLLGAEVLSGTFLMLGLGSAAVLVGLGDRFIGLSFVTELLTWAVLSAISIVLWKRYWKQPDRVQSGQSDDGLDVVGTVEETIPANGRGVVVFDMPVLGSSRWPARAAMQVENGTRVGIEAVDGQIIVVKPIKE